MTIDSDQWYLSYLRCPDCRGHLILDEILNCASCSYESANLADLRPMKPSNLRITHERILNLDIEKALDKINTEVPENNFKGPVALRDSRAFMGQISKLCPKGSKVLDLGCGPRDQASPIEWLGMEYVGVDYSSEQADFLADAHSLPFANDSFDCVFSYAVLEHLHQPFISIHEIQRVLKVGGVFVGSVSQGEPFHASYFHHTPWGFLSLVHHAGALQVERLWAGGDTLRALSNMGRYPKAVRALLSIVNSVHEKIPFLAPRRMRWNEKEKQIDALYRAGGLCFVCSKSSTGN